MNPITLTFAAARKEAARLAANLAKRVQRVEAAGANNAAVDSFRDLQQAAAPKTRNEAVSRVAALRKLDQSKGTRVATAAPMARREAAAAQRQATAEALVLNPRALPPRADVDALQASLRKSLDAKTRRVKESPSGSTQATDAYDEWKAGLTPNPSNRRKAADTRRLLEINNYQGVTVSGAKKQHDRGIQAFGDDYDNWSKEEKGAAWQGFRELADRMNTVISSEEVLAQIRTATKKGQLKVAFYDEEVDDGEGGTKTVLRAAVATNLDEAEQEAVHKSFMAEKLKEARSRSKPARLF